jgi:hypothetical protein
MIFTLATKVGMMKSSVGQYAWGDSNSAVSAARNERVATAQRDANSKAESRSERDGRDKLQVQDAQRRDDGRERRKLQAEDDCVVLLCRD